jgi:tRNA pseudouridine55 synthase
MRTDIDLAMSFIGCLGRVRYTAHDDMDIDHSQRSGKRQVTDMKSCHGLLVLDKPGGVTSRLAVDRAQRWFPRGTRIGHTGTLDPLATGVLVLCIGSATRLTEYVQDMNKTYRAGVLLGASSDTDDADGTVAPVAVSAPPDRETVARCLERFVGEIQQVPPIYSAAKVSGQRAYDLARRGKKVALSARPIRIYAIDILAYEFPHLEIEVRCGKGTYIRALARDLGGRLGCGALLESLRRTRVGPFDVADALGLDATASAALAHLVPVSAAVGDLPRVTLSPVEVMRLGQGQSVSVNPALLLADVTNQAQVAVFDPRGNLAAVAAFDPSKQRLLPVKVLPPEPKLDQ